ncbi:MAG: DUF4239 domain-containing protein [Gammaproteobacteria bacterium]|uniref:bestrophin-like domain n=1 Tax=Rhodoferax sp. TaxID=50421 RepID=UPI001DD769FE|nr:DUF4239 domain-containing protein [Rhodoferax sp.]MBU3898482.1 DUF4239 domain-containing protein [Gammaproteobacteria bacterium]MBU3997809.1 DUF4239 domain-containing protein [Gammaproteobacteria bacterium]MBU4079256.1 DUF4239 domain-containing protein [Gammaproteobacteria bacterium]MBU4112201.1 DUF4239 domain-containing protein [Gammaproteobacteria bacterium]MBU4171185.1 DUF4239 domain-containing protein [Gammaproteobacteria bacterium]
MSTFSYLLFMPQWLSVLLLLGLFVACGIGLVLLLRWLLPDSVLQPQNDAAGFVFGAVSAIYGIMLAFIVINVWVQSDNAASTVEHETSAALTLYRDLSAYPNRAEATEALALLRGVTLSIVKEEFPAIQAMKWDAKTQASLATQHAFNRLWDEIRQITPQNLQEQSLFNEILTNMNTFAQFRVKRLLHARTGLSGSLWAVVVLGGLITIGFIGLFGYEREPVRMVHASVLSFVLGGAICVIMSLNFPFVGNSGIGPDGYDYLIKLAEW